MSFSSEFSSGPALLSDNELPYCPFVRRTKFGMIVVNPYLDNRQRLTILGRALHGRLWKRATARMLRCERRTIYDWLSNRQPPDDAVNTLLRAAKAEISRLEMAIEETRLGHWLNDQS